MSHSKRSTARPFVTAHERAQIQQVWKPANAGQGARRRREALLAFGACLLCLERARDPVACAWGGEVFCRECVVLNVVAQREEIQRADEARRRQDEAHRRWAEQQTAQESQRALEHFERVQAGLDTPSASTAPPTHSPQSTQAPTQLALEDTPSSSSSLLLADGKKRKSTILDPEAVKRATREEHVRIRRELEAEREQKTAAHQSSFWTPASTPTVDPNQLAVTTGQNGKKSKKRRIKEHPMCPGVVEREGDGGDTTGSRKTLPHPLLLKSLVSLKFTPSPSLSQSPSQSFSPDTTASSSSTSSDWICSSCTKVLTNTSRAVVSRVCGHVVCYSCAEMLYLPPAELRPRKNTGETSTDTRKEQNGNKRSEEQPRDNRADRKEGGDNDSETRKDNDGGESEGQGEGQGEALLCFVCSADLTPDDDRHGHGHGHSHRHGHQHGHKDGHSRGHSHSHHQDEPFGSKLLVLRCEGTGFSSRSG